MTAARTQTVILSQPLGDPPTAPAPVRALGPIEPSAAFRATLAAGFVEDLDTWAARVLGEAS